MYKDPRILKSRTLSNLRDIGGYNCKTGVIAYDKLYRSDQPVNLKETEMEALINKGLRNILDLRNDYEKERFVNSFLNNDTVKVFEKDLQEEFYIQNPNYESPFKDYHNMEDHYIEDIKNYGRGYVEIIRYITGAEGITLVHCFAGKDRTGIVIALVLMLLEVSDQDIIDDYSATDLYMRKKLVKYLKVYIRTSSYIAKAKPGNMDLMIKFINNKYGSCYTYLEQHGYTQSDLLALKSKFIE